MAQHLRWNWTEHRPSNYFVKRVQDLVPNQVGLAAQCAHMTCRRHDLSEALALARTPNPQRLLDVGGRQWKQHSVAGCLSHGIKYSVVLASVSMAAVSAP